MYVREALKMNKKKFAINLGCSNVIEILFIRLEYLSDVHFNSKNWWRRIILCTLMSDALDILIITRTCPRWHRQSLESNHIYISAQRRGISQSICTLLANSKAWLERVSKDTWSSLLGLVVSDKGKMFYKIDTRMDLLNP